MSNGPTSRFWAANLRARHVRLQARGQQGAVRAEQSPEPKGVATSTGKLRRRGHEGATPKWGAKSPGSQTKKGCAAGMPRICSGWICNTCGRSGRRAGGHGARHVARPHGTPLALTGAPILWPPRHGMQASEPAQSFREFPTVCWRFKKTGGYRQGFDQPGGLREDGNGNHHRVFVRHACKIK